MYEVIVSRQAQKDYVNIKQAGLSRQVEELIRILTHNPYQTPPACEKLTSDLLGYYSRRINRRHRLVYEVSPCGEGLAEKGGAPCEGTVKVIRMWTHYE
jgi:Txe/YoeB family toxin of toxin-antitoxin system